MINRRFTIKKKLGEGRSAVYLCEDSEQTGKLFALKVLSVHSTDEEKAIFKNEFETIQKLNHVSIIQAYERGSVVEVTGGDPIQTGSKYLAMEYFDGLELADYSITNELQLKAIISQICSVLFYLHQSRYIYYDLKVENILVKDDGDKPLIKLIDLGFAKTVNDEHTNTILGTSEYLAPELLKNEPHDHRVDLYAFGILLYRLIYKRFPFDSTDKLEIYKAHIEKEFDFPETLFSDKIIEVIKKLLCKNPEERYFYSFQILYDLDIPITEELYRSWVPIKTFSDRTDILNIVNRYVTTPSAGEVIIIRGFERAGKTAVVKEIFSRYSNVVYLSNDRTKSGLGFIKLLLNKLIFNEFIYPKLKQETIDLIENIFKSKSENITSDISRVINQIVSLERFILLLDDFNSYDDFVIEFFKETFPIFQVKGCNIILTEKSDIDYAAGFINNSVILTLLSFTTVQIDELLAVVYAKFFPIREVRKLIMQYADFLPGNIIEFLNDLILLKIIHFDYEGIKISFDEKIEKLLLNLYDEIYQIRYKSLNQNEIEIASLLSSFEIIPEKNILLELSRYPEEYFDKNTLELQYKHVFQSQAALNFSSDGMKKFIYSQIADKKQQHQRIAEVISKKFPQFSKVELARHYQICENYTDSYTLLIKEADEAEKIYALKYARSVLEQTLKLPLSDEQNFYVKLKLAALYDTLNDFQNTYAITSELLQKNLSEDVRNELLNYYGNALIRIGEIEKGLEVLRKLLNETKDKAEKIKLMLNIAGAEIDNNNYEEASKICCQIINNSDAANEQKGDAFNLLGLVSINFKNDLNMALHNFSLCMNEYQKTGSLQHISAIEGNIGNIFNMRGEYERAESHWKKSLSISSSLGNFYHQAKVLLNYGGLNFNKLNFESAIEHYNKAGLIFNTLGDQYDLGLAESNLGEIYLFICEYQNAIEYLSSARDNFHKIQNELEESESLFMLGKLFYKIGDFERLAVIINELESIAGLNKDISRMNLHINYLQHIRQLFSKHDIDEDQVEKVAAEYISQEDKINYFEVIKLLVNYYLLKAKPTAAIDILTKEKVKETCNQNAYLESERLCLIGKAITQNSDQNLSDPFFYFQKAYELIKELTVTELTWQVILENANYYFRRGNYSKAKEFANYGRPLINYFKSKIKEERLVEIFLENDQRKKAWEKFTEILNTT